MSLEGNRLLLTEEESMKIKTALLRRKIKRRELVAQMNKLREKPLQESYINNIINRHVPCPPFLKDQIKEITGIK